MDAVDLLKREAELAFGQMQAALDGVTEGQAWAVLPPAGSDYLHSDGSIHGIALHVACCKFVYGSIGFRDGEVRWRHCMERVSAFEPSWEAALAYVKEAQEYWMASWASLTSEDLDKEVPHFSGKLWPTWKILHTVIDHEAYHAGQIAMLRYAVGESATPPPSVAEDIGTHCRGLPSW